MPTALPAPITGVQALRPPTDRGAGRAPAHRSAALLSLHAHSRLRQRLHAAGLTKSARRRAAAGPPNLGSHVVVHHVVVMHHHHAVTTHLHHVVPLHHHVVVHHVRLRGDRHGGHRRNEQRRRDQLLEHGFLSRACEAHVGFYEAGTEWQLADADCLALWFIDNHPAYRARGSLRAPAAATNCAQWTS